MEQVIIDFEEFTNSFSEWVKNIERANVILYSIASDSIILTFVYDFQFICNVSLKQLEDHYRNPDLSGEQMINMFIQEYLIHRAMEIKSIQKYIV